MTQPTPRPKTIYEMNIAELRATLVEMVSSGNYSFSPNDYANELQRRYLEEANRIAHEANLATQRAARRSFWATAIGVIFAAISAGAAVVALNNQSAPAAPQPIPVYGYCWDDAE